MHITTKRLASTNTKGENLYIRGARCPNFPCLPTNYFLPINETMSEYAKKLSNDVDLGARWASIAIREQLKEIQQGIPGLVRVPTTAPTMSILTWSSQRHKAAMRSPP